MSPPDLSTLPQRMRYAADVICEVINRKADLKEGRAVKHSPAELRSIAAQWERRDEQDQLIEGLAQEVYSAHKEYSPTSRRVEAPWAEAHESIREHSRFIARFIVESGWRKGDPA